MFSPRLKCHRQNVVFKNRGNIFNDVDRAVTKRVFFKIKRDKIVNPVKEFKMISANKHSCQSGALHIIRYMVTFIGIYNESLEYFTTFAIAVSSLLVKCTHPISNQVNDRQRGCRGGGHRTKVITVHTGRRPVRHPPPFTPVNASTTHYVTSQKYRQSHHVNNDSDTGRSHRE